MRTETDLPEDSKRMLLRKRARWGRIWVVAFAMMISVVIVDVATRGGLYRAAGDLLGGLSIVGIVALFRWAWLKERTEPPRER